MKLLFTSQQDTRSLTYFSRVVSRITCAPLELAIGKVHPSNSAYFLQVQQVAPCHLTGEPRLQAGREWLLSTKMSESEIIRTALTAVLAFTEHEARETFLVDGLAVMDPHFDLKTCVEWAAKRVQDKVAGE